MDPKTARALSEAGRIAARLAGVPDDVPITMTICPDREQQWPDLADVEKKPREEAEFFYAQTVA